MKRLVHVLTVADSLRFLRGQPRFMRERGYETHVVCGDGPLLSRFADAEGATAHPIAMERRVTPAADLRTVAKLARLLRRLRPDVVHAQTPKGGLLGTMAARVARAPRVLYHMRGLPHQGAAGLMRRVLWTTERTACGLADHVICQSHSLRRRALAERLVTPARSSVLGPGGNGVDAGRFDPARVCDASAQLREELRIPPGAPVVGFVGRLVGDKGIVELTEAWRGLRDRFPNAHLVLVGPFEARDAVPDEVRRELERAPRTHLTGERDDVAPWYGVMDILALPTYREGFPNVPIEAAAMGVPVVATRVDGCVDAVVDGQTGTLVPARDAAALEEALARYLADPELRRVHGERGRARALTELRPERIFEELASLYDGGAPSPHRRGEASWA